VNRRVAVGAVVAVAWVGGMVALGRREFFRGETERMAQAALLIAPGAEYYGITQDSERVGYASSTIDTSGTGIHVTELLVADLPSPAGLRRLAARSLVNLTRGMRLMNFQFELGASYGPYAVSGRSEGDSVLVLIVTAGTAAPYTTRVKLHGALMLPSTVPLALALEQRPKVGRRFTYTVYDPMSGTIDDATTVQVKAESLFVLTDSAGLAAAGQRWEPAHQDTVRAWLIEQSGGGLLTGWVDQQGRLVQASPLATFTIRRTAYEIAFQNWSLDNKEHPRVVLPQGAPMAKPTKKPGAAAPRD
jgi:hypothetical protein